jgi:hypothetical protein
MFLICIQMKLLAVKFTDISLAEILSIHILSIVRTGFLASDLLKCLKSWVP